MNENKIEVNLSFEEFKKKYENLITFKQIDAVNYKNLVTLKAIQEQAAELNFSDAWKKEIEDKFKSLEEIAKEEVKQAGAKVGEYIKKLIEATFEFHKPVCSIIYNDEVFKKVKELVTFTGQLEAEFIFNVTKILYINK